MRTLYDVLEVSEKASDRVIRSAYRSLVQYWHPDKHKDADATIRKRVQLINRAYEILSDARKRAAYDDQLARMRDDQAEDARADYSSPPFEDSGKESAPRTQATTHRGRYQEWPWYRRIGALMRFYVSGSLILLSLLGISILFSPLMPSGRDPTAFLAGYVLFAALSWSIPFFAGCYVFLPLSESADEVLWSGKWFGTWAKEATCAALFALGVNGLLVFAAVLVVDGHDPSPLWWIASLSVAYGAYTYFFDITHD